MIVKPKLGVLASPVHPDKPVTWGALATAVRSNVTPAHDTRKFENCGLVESYVNEPDAGSGVYPGSNVNVIA
jgi:hypothetical protein